MNNVCTTHCVAKRNKKLAKAPSTFNIHIHFLGRLVTCTHKNIDCMIFIDGIDWHSCHFGISQRWRIIVWASTLNFFSGEFLLCGVLDSPEFIWILLVLLLALPLSLPLQKRKMPCVFQSKTVFRLSKYASERYILVLPFGLTLTMLEYNKNSRKHVGKQYFRFSVASFASGFV